MKTLHALLISVLSGIILSFSWPATGNITPLVFVGLVPLLYVEHRFQKGHPHLFTFFFVAFFTWNLGTSWWIWMSTKSGMLMTTVFNSFMMSVVFMLFHITKKKVGTKEGYVGLLLYWMAWEWINLEWEFSWPWLHFGHAFADRMRWIQWYEYTGVSGGSLWVLSSNLLFFAILRGWIGPLPNLGNARKAIVFTVPFLVVPLIVSYSLSKNYEEWGQPVDVVLIQPNIDPYNEKFDALSGKEQVQIILDLAQQKADQTTDFFLAPETALTEEWTFGDSNSTTGVKALWKFIRKHPKSHLIIGCDYIEREGQNAKRYNAALFISANSEFDLHFKSKLVPGVERTPYGETLSFLKALKIDLGGPDGEYQKADTFKIFQSFDSDVKGAPLICYESVYGDHLRKMVLAGANVIFLITNDGWWGNTPGHQQHLAIARLRCIESRRSMARSANTGISCFIDQRGQISSATNYGEAAVVKGSINTNEIITFYSKHGDYLYRIALFLSVLLLLLTFVRSIQSGAKKGKLK